MNCSIKQLMKAEVTIERWAAKRPKDLKGLLERVSPDLGLVSSTVTEKELLELFSDNSNILNILKNMSAGDKTVKEEKLILNRNNVVPQLTAPIIPDLFHNMHILKSYFEKRVKELLTHAVIINEPDATMFVTSDYLRNENIKRLKNNLFKDIIDYLIEAREVNRVDFYDNNNNFQANLYVGGKVNRNVVNSTYEKILTKLFQHLVDQNGAIEFGENNNRKIPRLSENISQNRSRIEAYNAAVFLSNFDDVVRRYYGNILTVNGYTTFNTFDSPLTEAKYQFNTKGEKEEFWLEDSQESEAAEQSKDALTGEIISIIRRLDKKKKFTNEYLSMKDFYGLAASFAQFQALHLKELSEDPEWELLSKNPGKALRYYINKILYSIENDLKDEYYVHFKNILGTIYSIDEFLKEIEVKERGVKVEKDGIVTYNPPKMSILDIISQPLNNSFGATYAIYNPTDGSVTYKELYSHNMASSTVDNMIYTKLSMSGDRQHLYNTIEVDKLKTDINFSNYIRLRFGLNITADNISDLKDVIFKDYAVHHLNESEEEIQKLKTKYLKDYLTSIINKINGSGLETSMFTKIAERERKISEGGGRDSDTPATAIKDLIDRMQAIKEVFLDSYIQVPITTITTASGEKIPTYKLSNLTYNDSEVLLRRMKFEKENDADISYRNMFLKGDDPLLLGTTTKLEIVNKGKNKSAVAWSPAENFTASFVYDFLGLYNDKTSWLNVVIGNYSDKNTILAKKISLKAKTSSDKDGKFIIGSDSNAATIDEIVDTAYNQQSAFFGDTYASIIKKYNALFDIKLSTKMSDWKTAYEVINKKLAELGGRNNFLKLAEKKNIDITAELDYSAYGKKDVSLNQNLFDYFAFYSSKEKYKEYIGRELDNLVFDILNFKKGRNSKYLLNNTEFASVIGENKLEDFLNFFGLTKEEMDPFVSTETEEYEIATDEYGTRDLTALLIRDEKGNINPLLKRWMMVNMLFRNEYLNVTVKHEYMHSAKGLPKRTSEDIGNILKYELEASPRYSGMAKRNVAFTSTYEVGLQGSRYGVPEKVNIAVIEDPSSEVYNISGQTENVKHQDGGSSISYLYSKMIAKSYPGKEYKGTLKRFGTFITDYGSAVKKDAEVVINNASIRASSLSELSHLKLHQQMLSSHDINIGEFNTTLDKEYYYNENGQDYRLVDFRIVNNELTRTVELVDKNGVIVPKSKVELPPIKIKNLFDIWKALGAQYSESFKDGKAVYNENSNDLLYDLITTYEENGDYVLKTKFIHGLSNESVFKSGAVNLNPSNKWKDGSALRFATFESAHMGPQLDPSHEADASKIKEITQVISGLSQNEKTADLANEVYDDLARMIKEAASNYLNILNDINDTKLNKLYNTLSREFVRHLANSPGVDLASIIAETFKEGDIVPFSNKNFFQQFIKDLIVKLNTEFITRYYKGLGAVLNPSHKIIQIYSIPTADGKTVTYTQEDFAKEALANYVHGPVAFDNETIISNYIANTYPDIPTKKDEFQLMDIVRLPNGEVLRLDTPEIYYNFKENTNYPDGSLKKVISMPRDLKPQETVFNVIDVVDLEKAKKNKAELFTSLDLTNSHLKKIKAEYAALPENQDSFYDPKTGKIVLNEKVKGTNAEKLLFLHEFVGHHGISNLFEGEDKETYKNVLFATKDYLYNNAQHLIDRSGFKTVEEMATTYGFDLNTEEGQLQVIEELLARQAEQDTSLTWFQKTIGRLQILLAKVFGLSKPMSKEGVIELLLMAKKSALYKTNFSTQLKEDEKYFPVTRTMNLFDLPSTRWQYNLSQGNITPEIEQFAKHFKINIKDTARISKYLQAWTQRNLDLLDEGRVMKGIDHFREGDIINFEDYFGTDSLVSDIYDDVKDHYINRNSLTIYNYKFNPAELILPNIYKTTFNNGNDTIVEIKNKGSLYFQERLSEQYNEDNTNADLRIDLENGKKVYVKLVVQFPLEPENKNMFLDDTKNGQDVQYRITESGEKLYVKPKDSKVIVDENNNDIIYIKVAEYNQLDQASVLRKRNLNQLPELIKSFKNISALVPIMNGTESGVINKGQPVNLRNEIVKTFTLFTKLNFAPVNIGEDWYLKNRNEIIDKLANKRYASWEKSHEFVAARIPAQSMQSFMPMNNVAYFNTNSNDAYVSVWQIWLQGSDFDVDKAYIMGYGFGNGAQLDISTELFDYSSKEELDAIEKLPIPTGTLIKFKEIPESLDNLSQEEIEDLNAKEYDPTNDFEWFANIDMGDPVETAKQMKIDEIIKLGQILRRINKSKYMINLVETQRVDEDEFNSFIGFINTYNMYRGYLYTNYSLQNSVVGKIKNIISSPSNQILSSIPISIQQLHDGAKAASEETLVNISKVIKKWISNKDKDKTPLNVLIASFTDTNVDAIDEKDTKALRKGVKYDLDLIMDFVKGIIDRKARFSPGNGTGMFKQQYQAAVGKRDVGIGANGLKVFFALSSYYNDWYRKVDGGDINISIDNIADPKLFNKQLYVNHKMYTKVSIADTRVSRESFRKILNLYGYEGYERELAELNKAQAALAISGFVSGATDNAKELVMAKINAVVSLASMHLYMMALGFTSTDISLYMNSDLAKYVANNIETNTFEGDDDKRVPNLVKSYFERPGIEAMYDDLEEVKKVRETFLDIYDGAQEFKMLSNIFSVNGTINAEPKELNNFLNTIEKSMYGAEVKAFNFNLGKVKNLKNGEPKDSDKQLIIKNIVDRNSSLTRLYQINPAKVESYIWDTLMQASKVQVSYINYYGQEQTKEVSLIGGEFDARYYMFPKNKKYRELASKYYNLIKNTVNVFDVLENVPHFREMSNSVGIVFNIALLSSKKFNFVFSYVRDIYKSGEGKNEDKQPEIRFGKSKQDKVKHIFGNEALAFDIDDRIVNRALTTYDNYAIAGWLKSNDPKVVGLKFSVQDLLKASGIAKITLNADDTAKVYSPDEIKEGTKSEVINVTQTIFQDSGEDKIVDLTSDTGISNFKIIMEKLAFQMLEDSERSDLGKQLSLRNIKDSFGLFATKITPTYGLQNMNNPVSIENFIKLLNEFNAVDSKIEDKFKVRNTKGKVIKWGDLLFIYNLIVNNEAYGDLRITPLFEDYVKDPNNLGRSYLKFSSEADRATKNSEKDLFGINATGDLENVLKAQQRNNILFLTLHGAGYLQIGNDLLTLRNGNYPINTTLARRVKNDGIDYQIMQSIMSMMQSQNLIINYNCE